MQMPTAEGHSQEASVAKVVTNPPRPLLTELTLPRAPPCTAATSLEEVKEAGTATASESEEEVIVEQDPELFEEEYWTCHKCNEEFKPDPERIPDLHRVCFDCKKAREYHDY